MSTNNSALIDALLDESRLCQIGHSFIDKSHGESGLENMGFIHIAQQMFSTHAKILHSFSESPIEKILLGSYLLCCAKYGDVLTSPFLPKADDALLNMKQWCASIASLQDYIERTKKTSEEALNEINRERDEGRMSEDDWSFRFGLLFNYGLFKNEANVHIIPQASFPKFYGRKGIRVDFIAWSPVRPKFRVAIECDGFTYHANEHSFETDRIRSRKLQELGFKVLQYSGREIYADPAGAGIDLKKKLNAMLAGCRKNPGVLRKHHRELGGNL